jgi:adenosylcobinamide hydrolase
MSEVATLGDPCRVRIPDGRWLDTGVDGGFSRADRALNLTVPTDFERRDVRAYVAERCESAGLDPEGPALLTAVEQEDARGARAGSATVLATAGLSNPASLPVPEPASDCDTHERKNESPPTGTVNLLVGTTASLDQRGLASCLATAVEAKAATLQALTGFTGTTSDAVAVGADPTGESVAFVGSSTELGSNVRAAVRGAVSASLEAVYPDGEFPATVDAAAYGTRTSRSATVFEP